MAGTLGEDLLECAVSGGAWAARPFDIGDIDAHPDCNRIWATILAIRDVSYDIQEVVSEEAVAKAEIEWQESVVSEFEKELEGYKISITMKDGDTELVQMTPLPPEKRLGGGDDVDFLRDAIKDSLGALFDRESENLAEVLGDAGRDLVEMRAEKAADKVAHEKNVARLKDYVSEAAKDAKMEQYDRRVLRSGRPDESLFKRLKKDDLVKITAVAMALAYGRTPR